MMKSPAARTLVLVPIVLASLVLFAGAQNSRALFTTEKFVISAVRIVHSAQSSYQATSGNGNFGSLQDLRKAHMIDSALASGSKYGYTFVVTHTPWSPGTPARFRLTATPSRYPRTGRTSYFIDESGEIRGADKNGEPANETDPLIDECALFGPSAFERCAVWDMQTLHGAQATFQATAGNGSFGTLAQLGAAGLIRQSLATGQTHGYLFTIAITPQTPQSPARFTISAVPQTYGTTGIRSFFTDETGVLRGADRRGQPATANDPPLDEF